MKQKTLALILAAAMAVALTACNNTAGNDPTPTPTDTVQTPADTTPTDAGDAGQGGAESTYTTVINDAEVVLTISADQKSISADVMGMKVEGSCEVADGVLTLKEMTSGNAQIWAGLASNPYTLNEDGTATSAGASEQQPADEKEELFAWEGYAALVFNKDGTYDFNYNDMVKESGTWTWENWKLTVTDAEGNEMVGSVDKEDDNTLKLEFTAVINSQLVVNFTAASSVWGPALGATGTYTPVGGTEGTAASGGVERFAGEYDLYCEEKDMYCEEFVIDADGTVHGVVESSGLTSFTGTVSEDGTITAEVTRLGGTMEGTITDDLQVQVHFEVRGSTSDFVGGPL